ncbi:peptidylprolyl isomerase [Octadecabacter sp. 1_MG-2023]|uniref:peptidylprolyl isomerase n=1 Tax=unclassified Octadecabacter TaxID=196158 RepID=UPI001C08C4E1|nr:MULTISPECIES: peptidylprolyl isomerase [unclassified Octadecabacter]MBU2992267.1 peptidylprolyl isomerase [Octadecabacter sp. B2R22]MDO6734977.1 peptidylprolyl isomerase [Octadecabacter sp. 1_MG-2023]
MLFRTNLLASAAIFAITSSVALADSHSEMTAETVIASVDGSDITLGQLIMLRAQLPEQYQQLPDEVIFDGLVEQLVNQQLLADTLEVQPKRVAIALSNETRSLRAGEVVNALSEMPITDADLQAAYDARFEGVEPEQEFNASHILVETEEEATEVKTMIDDGADFAETAMERSTGPSGPSGGELGWFGAGMMVPEFEAAVIDLEVGEVSAPVQTQFGWHVVTLNETRTQPLPTLDDLRGELTTQIQQEALNARLTELTEAADITLPEEGQFDASMIQNLDLLED